MDVCAPGASVGPVAARCGGYGGYGGLCGFGARANWCALTLLTLLLLPIAGAGRTGIESLWPQVDLPQDAVRFDIASAANVNGWPMQIHGFLSSKDPEQLLVWFRSRLGQPLVENVLGEKHILGRAQGEHYITLQLEPVAGHGTRGVIAMTRLKSAEHMDSEQGASQLPSGWGAGSQLLNRITSVDGGKLSTYVVLTNGDGEALNLDRVNDMMKADGLTQQWTSNWDAFGSGKTVFFTASNKEAVAIVYRAAVGTSAVVLNRVSWVEPSR